MLYGFILGILTYSLLFGIIILMTLVKNNKRRKIIYRQSDMHNLLKIFFSKQLNIENSFISQLKKRKENKTIKAIIIQNKAYWVMDNIFYIGSASDGKVIPETGVPVDTTNMSKPEIDKLLFILDNLKGGKNNDSSSTGNE